MENQFYEFAIILAIAALYGAIGRLLRQPLIVVLIAVFIAVGICVGAAWLGITTVGDQIELLARMGIAILLFLVGLRLDLHMIRTMGPVALATRLEQALLPSVVGFLICMALGLAVVPELCVAVALTFSSMIIIVQAVVRQTRDRLTAWADRGRFSDRPRHRCGAGDDRPVRLPDPVFPSDL